MIRRLALVAALVGGSVLHSAPEPSAAVAPDLLTRMQIRVTTSSDWTSVDLQGIDVRARRTSSTTSTDAVWDKTGGWTVVRTPGTSQASAVIDLFGELTPTDAPRIVAAKGREGTARVEVLAANAGDPRLVTEVVLDTQDPVRNVVSADIDRSALLADELVLPEVDDRNLALAFYYPWFGARAPADSKVSPDKPASWYATTDRQHIQGMVGEAAGAGLDGFIVAWEGALHGEVVDRLVDEVETRSDFFLAPVLELRAMRTRTLLEDRFDPSKAAVALADWFLRVPAANRLEVDGRPVVVAFGMWDLSAAEWRAFRTGVAHLDPFIIGDRDDPSLAVEGAYHYDPNTRSISELEATYAGSMERARLQPALDPSRQQLLWAATASPGFDNSGSKLLLGRRFTDRAGGWRYDQTWRVAVESRPEWVFVTSWNEWYEQTHISPGRTTGRAALDQTTTWTERFHASPR